MEFIKIFVTHVTSNYNYRYSLAFDFSVTYKDISQSLMSDSVDTML